MDSLTPRPRRRSATTRRVDPHAWQHRRAYILDGRLYTLHPDGALPVKYDPVPLISHEPQTRPIRRDWLGPCNVLRPRAHSLLDLGRMEPEAGDAKLSSTHTRSKLCPLDVALTHLAGAAARLQRCGPAFQDACEQLWFFAAGSWSWAMWETTVEGGAGLEGKGGLVAELCRARMECHKALWVLEKDGEEDFERDAEDLREVLEGLGLGL